MKNKKKKNTIKQIKQHGFFCFRRYYLHFSYCSADILFTFLLAYTSGMNIGDKVFVGLENYKSLFSRDKTFHTAIINNLVWIVLTIFITMSVSLAFAVVLNKKVHRKNIF